MKEKLKRFPGRSAVEGHIQTYIPIYTVLLLMEYAVKAVIGCLSARQGGQADQNEKSLERWLPGFYNSRKCFVLECEVTCHIPVSMPAGWFL